MATIQELMSEIETFKSQIKSNSIKCGELEVEHKKLRNENKELRLKIQERDAQFKLLKKETKIQSNLARLHALEEARAAVGFQIHGRPAETGDTMPVAAHRSAEELLGGSLDEDADVEGLKSDLDIF